MASRDYSLWRRVGATRRAFLSALAVLAASGVLPTIPVRAGGGRWSAWSGRVDADGQHWVSPVHESRHPFTAIGALWADGVPPSGAVEVRASAEGDTWTAWHALPLDGDGPGLPHSTLLFLPLSYLAQYRLTRPGPLPRLALVDTSDGPSAADLGVTLAGGSARWSGRLLSAERQTGPAVTAPPSIVTRARWGADESLRWWIPEYRVIDHLAIHHTGAAASRADPAAAVRSVYHYHTAVLDWGDIGYHYLVDWTGAIYEGRYGGPNVVGGHIRGHNPGCEGIAALGNYDGIWPSDELEQALVSLLAWRAEQLGLDPQGWTPFGDGLVPTILGHRDAAQTSCPGYRLYVDLTSLRAQTRLRLGYVPQLGAELVDVRLPPRQVEVGERVPISFTVRNTGTIPLPAGAVPAELVYLEGAGAASRGLRVPAATVQLALGTVEDRDAARRAAVATGRAGVDPNAGEDGPDRASRAPEAALPSAYPYRWGLPRDLLAGEAVACVGHLRPTSSGTRRWVAAIVREAGDPLAETAADLALDVVAPTAVVRTAVAPAPDGLAFPWLGNETGALAARLALVSASARPLDVAWLAPEQVHAARLPAGGADYWEDGLTGVRAASVGGTGATAPSPSGELRPLALGSHGQAARLTSSGAVAAVLRLRPSEARRANWVTYAGLSGGAPRLWIPLTRAPGRAVADSPVEPTIAVQNLGPRAVPVRLTWSLRDGASAVRNSTLAAGETGRWPLPPDAIAGRVESDEDGLLAGVAVTPGNAGSLLAYPLPTHAGERLLVPLVGGADGWRSALVVMNTADLLADVRWQWAPYGGGAAREGRLSLARGVAATLASNDELGGQGFGAARIWSDGAPLVGLTVFEREDEGVSFVQPVVAPEGELLVPLADLGGLPQQRRLAVLSADEAPLRLTIEYRNPAGAVLDRSEDGLAGPGARLYPLRPSTADAATIHLRSEGAPVVAALVQTP